MLPDTDGDGLTDGAETYSRQIQEPSLGASLVAEGPGAAVLGVSLHPVQGFADVAGGLGVGVDVLTAAPLSRGTLTLTFDPAAMPAGARPALLHFDEATGAFDLPADQAVDLAAGTVTVRTTAFSPFLLVDLNVFEALWAAEIVTPREADGTEPQSIDAVLAIDGSSSMTWNDPEDKRFQAADSFVDALLAGDRAAVVGFDHEARLHQALTSDLAAARAAIPLTYTAGGTDVGVAVAASLDELDARGQTGRGRVVVLLTNAKAPTTRP